MKENWLTEEDFEDMRRTWMIGERVAWTIRALVGMVRRLQIEAAWYKGCIIELETKLDAKSIESIRFYVCDNNVAVLLDRIDDLEAEKIGMQKRIEELTELEPKESVRV